MIAGCHQHGPEIGLARTGAPGVGDEPACEQEQDHRREDDEDDRER